MIYRQAVANVLGLDRTDHKCSSVLEETGPITAGELAAVMGLTTGALTGIIDRLEKAGLARRVKDPPESPKGHR